MNEVLLGSEVPLGRLDGSVTKEHLDLLEFAASSAAQFCARAAQVMRCEAGNTDLGRLLAEHLPDDLLAKAVAGNTVAAAHRTEHLPIGDSGGCRPSVNRDFHPVRHRSRADSTVLADEVDNAPAAIPLLDVRERERCHFRSAQSAAEQHSEYGAVAQAAQRRNVGRV